MENKERYHNATSIAPLVGLEPTTLGCWQPMLYQLSYQGKMGRFPQSWYSNTRIIAISLTCLTIRYGLFYPTLNGGGLRQSLCGS